MRNFDFFNINYTKGRTGSQFVIRGDVQNRSGRHYTSVALRIIFFNKLIPIINEIIVVNDLPSGSTKSFEKYVEEVDYDLVAKQITRYEVSMEDAY